MSRATPARSSRPRVMMIGFDSAAPHLIERGISEGWLPHLARLRERGAYGRLETTSEWLVSSHWASFSTGVPPHEHGCYHFVQWRPDEMALKRLDAGHMIRPPFWRELAAEGTPIVAFDVPYTPPPTGERPTEAIELSGWATNELIFDPYTHPPRLRERIEKAYGGSLRESDQGLAFEKYSPRPLAELLRLRDQLVDILDRSADLARELAELEPWELFLAVFGPPHRAGHLLWSTGSVAGETGPEDERALEGALKDVYAATDRAIGRMLDVVPEGVHVLVFGIIGMGHNTSRTDLLPAMLARVLAADAGAEAAHEKLGLAKRLRGAIPLEWRHAVKTRLPLKLQDRLSLFWRTGRVDWSRTRAISLTADVNGYVRINLRGREARGIVEPGEFDGLCAEIADGLASFRDSVTGEPVVAAVRRTDELFPPGARRDALPDLIVRWAPSPCAGTADVVSPRFGTIAWPTPGKNPNGRSGNHTDEGFVLAVGDGVTPGSTLEPHRHILDLPPTIYALLGREPPAYMSGSVLPEIIPTPTAARRDP